MYASHKRANGSANRLAHHTKIKRENKLYHKISGWPPEKFENPLPLCKNIKMTHQKVEKPPCPILKI
jgi:hypothetical protein